MSNFAIPIKILVDSQQEAVEIANKCFQPLGYNTTDRHAMAWTGSCGNEPTYLLSNYQSGDVNGKTSIYPENCGDYTNHITINKNNTELIIALASQRKDGPYQKGEWLSADWTIDTNEPLTAIICFLGEDNGSIKYSEGYLFTTVGFNTDSSMVKAGTIYCRATAEEIINYFTNLKPKSNNPQQSVEQTTTTMQTISRIGLESIYNVACSSWKNKIQEMGKRNVFSSEIALTDSEVEEMFKAASTDQKAVLRKFFKEPEQEFNATMLQPGEMMQSNSTSGATVYVLRVHNTLVGFNKLGQHTLTWSHEYQGFKGKKLASGSEFTLTVK